MNKLLSVVMPCLNEAETLAVCIEKAQLFLIKIQLMAKLLLPITEALMALNKLLQNLEQH